MSNRYSKQERLAILRKFAESGMSMAQFSRWAGLPQRRLRGWMDAAREPRDLNWVRVELEPEHAEEGVVERC